MILGIGIDIIHLPRIQALLTRKPTSLLHFPKRILSDGELIEFNNTFLSKKKINLEQVIDNNVVKFLAVR
jgi:phosphopantetheinyl transferase (holo-ACP synthase)